MKKLSTCPIPGCAPGTNDNSDHNSDPCAQFEVDTPEYDDCINEELDKILHGATDPGEDPCGNLRPQEQAECYTHEFGLDGENGPCSDVDPNDNLALVNCLCSGLSGENQIDCLTHFGEGDPCDQDTPNPLALESCIEYLNGLVPPLKVAAVVEEDLEITPTMSRQSAVITRPSVVLIAMRKLLSLGQVTKVFQILRMNFPSGRNS
jgi:hypothetical protein